MAVSEVCMCRDRTRSFFLLYNKYRGREKIPAPFFKEMVIVSGIPL